MSQIMMPQRDGQWLVYAVSLETQTRQGAAGKRIAEYFDAVGYEQTQLSPTMIFERGFSLSSLYNPNPKSQKTIVHVDFASTGTFTIVEVQMRVNRMGNRPLSKDYEFWDTELRGMQQALDTGILDPQTSYYAAERARWYSITVMLTVLVVVLMVLMLGSLTYVYMALLSL